LKNGKGAGFMRKIIAIIVLTGLIVSTVLIPISANAVSDGKVIYATGFEFGNSLFDDTIFWQGANVNTSNSGYTTNSTEVIAGTRSYKYALNIQNDWNDMGGSNAAKLTMSGGKTYTVAFKFKSTDISEFTIKAVECNVWTTSYELYFNATNMLRLGGISSESAYRLSDLGAYKYVEFTFTAPLNNNSYFTFAAKGNGANPTFILEDFFVYQGAMAEADAPSAQQLIISDNFENGFGNFVPFIVPTLSFQSCAFITNKQNEVINQAGSVIGSLNYPTEGTQWCAYMSTRDTAVNILGAATYTVKFRYKILTAAQNFFYFIIKGNATSDDRYIGFNSNGIDSSFLNGVQNYKLENDGDYKILTATFTTADSNGYTLLQFGSNGGGKILFDDVAFYKGLNANDYNPAAYTQLSKATKILSENFEEGFGNFTTFIVNNIAAQAYAKITSDSTMVINGSRSVIGAWNYPTEGTEWSAFMKTKAGVLNIEGNTNYTIKFRYKILTDATSFFYVDLNNSDPLKSQYLGFNNNGADFNFASGVSNYKIENDGEFKILTVVLSTVYDGAGYTTLDFGAKGGGKIIFDDVSVYKGIDETTYNNAAYTSRTLKFAFGNDFDNDLLGTNFWVKNTDDFGSERITDSRKINGSSSYMLFSKNTAAWSDILYSDILRQGTIFKANTRYTVTFKYKKADKALCENLSTSNFYFALKPNDGNASYDYHIYQGFDSNGKVLYINGANIIWQNGIEEFEITDSNDGYYNAKITFKTFNRDDYRIVFGIMNGGAFIVDDVNAYEWNAPQDIGSENTGDNLNLSYLLLTIFISGIMLIAIKRKIYGGKYEN